MCFTKLKAGLKLKLLKKIRSFFSRNSNLKVLKFKARGLNCSFSQKESFSPLRNDIMRRICPIELKFSGFVVLSKFCKQSNFPYDVST